jgi:ssDNA-binding protein
MSTTTAQEQTTKVVIGPVRLSYLHVWEPSAMEGQTEKKYSASLIIPKKDKATIAKVNAAIDAAKEQGKTSKWGGKIPKKLWNPLQDGDTEKEGDEAYEASLFINAKAATRPGIVDKNRQPILAQDEVYSGCYGFVSVTFYPFDKNGNAGIAAGLNHIMKSKDGEPLGGRSSADSDFAGIELEDDDDLM